MESIRPTIPASSAIRLSPDPMVSSSRGMAIGTCDPIGTGEPPGERSISSLRALPWGLRTTRFQAQSGSHLRKVVCSEPASEIPADAYVLAQLRGWLGGRLHVS